MQKIKEFDYSMWDISARWVLEDFLKHNPTWQEAMVISAKIDWDEFKKKYPNSYYWVVKELIVRKKNKDYYFIIREKRRPYGEHGVIVKRRYNEGEKPIRRRRKYDNYKYNLTQAHVQVTGSKYKNDCQLWAFASLMDVSYDEAYTHLSKVGWAEKSTYNTEGRWKRALNSWGVEFTLFWNRWEKKKGVSLKNIFEIVPKKGRFLIFIRGHVLSVVDGKIYDNAASSPYCHIMKIFEIKK